MRILCFPWSNGLARTSRLLSVALELRDAGVEVAFAGEGRYVCGDQSIVLPEGLSAFPIPDTHPDESLNGNTLRFLSEEKVRKFVAAELELMKEWKPDAILVDFRPSATLSAQITGIPSFCLNLLDNTHYSTRRIPAPADHAGTLWAQKLMGRRFGKKVADLFAPWGKHIDYRSAARPIDRVARDYGIASRKNFFSWFEGSALNFITDIPEWTPHRKLPSNYQFVGPIVWNPSGYESEWEEIQKRLPQGTKVVYISFGSTGRSDVFHALLDAARGRQESFIVTTGDQVELSNVPDNMRVAKFLPGQKVMASADLVVCHGGSGTLFQAVEAGKPVYAIAMRADQEWNAKEVTRHTLGIATTAREILQNRDKLSKDLDRLLDDPEVNRNVMEFAEKLKPYSGAQRAGEEIRNWMKHHRTSSLPANWRP